MMAKHKKKTGYQNWLVPGAAILVLLCGVIFVAKVFMTPDTGYRKTQISTVTLLKPPPPEQKEKMPEPEKPKEIPKETPKESIATPNEMRQDQPPSQSSSQSNDQSSDQTSAGDNSGVDGPVGTVSDAFGQGKGGGTYKIGGSSGRGGGGMGHMSLMAKFGWYNKKIQDEIKKQVRKRLDQNGGTPKGKYEVKVHILLDHQGSILKSQIKVSSGNDKIDEAISSTLPGLRISQPPPDGMPKGMTIRLSWQG